MEQIEKVIQAQMMREKKMKQAFEQNLYQFILQRKIENREKYSALLKKLDDSLIQYCIEEIGTEKLLKGIGIRIEPELYLSYLYQNKDSEMVIPFFLLNQIDQLYELYPSVFHQHGVQIMEKDGTSYRFEIHQHTYQVLLLKGLQDEQMIFNFATQVSGTIGVGFVKTIYGMQLHYFVIKNGLIYDFRNHMIMRKEDYFSIYQVESLECIDPSEIISFSSTWDKNLYPTPFVLYYQKKIGTSFHK